jgi:predicted RNase H-like nuclease (RuvC/YqgF family)
MNGSDYIEENKEPEMNDSDYLQHIGKQDRYIEELTTEIDGMKAKIDELQARIKELEHVMGLDQTAWKIDA